MSNFSSLSVLRAAVAGQKTDLSKVRSLTEELRKKVAAVANRTQFNERFIQQETGKLREEFQQKASAYLDQRGTYESFKNCRAQTEYWSVPAFLSRSPGAPTDQPALLKVISLQLASQRMPVATLAALADHAVISKDWPSLGVAYNELSFRSVTDGNAEVAQRMLDQAKIPDIVEAKNLIGESRQVEEFVGYALKSLSTGENDLGISMEAIERAGQEPDKARQQAMLREEMRREGAVVQWQRSA